MENPNSVDSMLNTLYPDVDPALKIDRKGNPLDQALSVARGELTRDEIFKLVTVSGVSKEFTSLPDSMKSKIADGLSSLWKIDRLGRGVEGKDRDIMGKVDEMKQLVEDKLHEINSFFHAPSLDWLPYSVGSLVKAGLEKDHTKWAQYRHGVMSGPDNYLRTLSSAGNRFEDRRASIKDPNSRESIGAYIFEDRQTSIINLRNILNRNLGGVMQSIEPLPENGKGQS